MITIRTAKGKFFFSDFVNLFEEQSAEIDENALDLKELQYLLSAYNTRRIYTNEEDYVKVRDRIALLSTSSSGGINTSISTAVNAAITVVVDGAPTTFDTLREIAEWIENDGVAATDLASAIAGKADRTELSDYATVVAMTQLEGQVSDGLSNKVDKEAGKGLSTEDFTTAYKTKLDDIDNQKLDIPTSVSSSTITTPTVNSIPLYTLGNNGEYVLCTPDAWLNINGLLVPGYSATTLGV